MKKLLFVLPLLLSFISPAQAQQVQCPTQAPGTNNNTCASTAFVQTAIGGSGSNLPSGQIFVGNGSNLAQARTMSGDCTLTNTGVITCIAGSAITSLSGDVTGTGPGATVATLATVNANVGSFGSATAVGTFTVNAKGLITAASNTNISVNLATMVTGTLPMSNGGTGATSFTANAPVIGAGASALTVGTKTGDTTLFATASGSLVSGNCIKADASGNLVDNGAVCGSSTPAGSDTQVQFNNSSSFGASANLTWVSPKLTIGVAGSTAGQLAFANATSGSITIQAPAGALGSVTMTLPAATDTFVGKATTDTFTNKTYDTAGTGNAFSINSQPVTSVSGNTTKVATFSGALTNGDCVSIDASGNLVAAGGACTVGGGGGTVSAASVNQIAIYTGATTVSGLTNLAGGILTGSGVAVPAFTRTPTLGLAGTATGTLTFAGATSGGAVVTPQAAAGTPTLTLPTATGTFVTTATAPLAINSTTGAVSVTGAAGQVLAGSSPAFTATPTLGVSGATLGTIALAGNTSGTATIRPQAAAGTPTLTLPNASGTFAVSGTYPFLVNTTTGNLDFQDVVNGSVLNSTTGVPFFTSIPLIGRTGSGGGIIINNGVTAFTTGIFASGATGANWNFTLPSGPGTSGQVLSTNGSGATTWNSISTGSIAWINVKTDYSATGNGVTNDTSAINAAIAAAVGANKCVYFPASNPSYNVTTLTGVTATNPNQATITMTIASPAVVSWTSHGFTAGNSVTFTTTGALPTGVVAGTTYYIISAGLSANSFRISDTIGGSAINTSGSQSGTHTGRGPGYSPCFIGDSPNNSIISTASATGSVIDITAPAGIGTHYLIRDLGFTASVTRTNNGYIESTAHQGYIHRTAYKKCFYCIDISDQATMIRDASFEMDQTTAIASAKYVVIGRQAAACEFGCTLDNLYSGTVNLANQPTAGIDLINAANLLISNANLIRCGNCFNVTPSSGSVGYSDIVNSYFDSSTSGVVIRPTGTGTVQRIHFTQVLTNSHSAYGFYVENAGAGTVQGINCTGCTASGNTLDGFSFYGVTNGFELNHSSASQNRYGVVVGANVNDFTIMGGCYGTCGGWTGNSQYGINILAGTSDNYIVSLTRLRGNTVGTISDGGSGVNKVVSNNIL